MFRPGRLAQPGTNSQDRGLVQQIHQFVTGAHRSGHHLRATGKYSRYMFRPGRHTHQAGIYDGVYTAVTSSVLDLGYNRGPSSWSHSHIVTYANGKRAIITIWNGKWRA